MAKPSNLSSAAYSTALKFNPSRQRLSKASASLSSNALFKESIGTTCLTSEKRSLAWPLTLCDGESEVIQSGCSCSIANNSR